MVKGTIQQAKIFGDFFAAKPIEELEEKLIGQKHEEAELKKILRSADLTDYFGKVTLDEIMQVFF